MTEVWAQRVTVKQKLESRREMSSGYGQRSDLGKLSGWDTILQEQQGGQSCWSRAARVGERRGLFKPLYIQDSSASVDPNHLRIWWRQRAFTSENYILQYHCAELEANTSGTLHQSQSWN